MLKVAGWNILRAASVRSLLQKLTKNGQEGQSAQFSAASDRDLMAISHLLAA
jgi:hypothetical protein